MIDKKVLIIDDDADLRQLAGMLFKEGRCRNFHGPRWAGWYQQVIYLQAKSDHPGCRNAGNQWVRGLSADSPGLGCSYHYVNLAERGKGHAAGLESGADDFLSKPFSADVLIARAKTVLRRSQKGAPPSPNYEFNNGHLSIDIDRRQVLVDEKRLKLSPIEFRLSGVPGTSRRQGADV